MCWREINMNEGRRMGFLLCFAQYAFNIEQKIVAHLSCWLIKLPCVVRTTLNNLSTKYSCMEN